MRIEHIAIWTTNLEGLLDFYCRYFGGIAHEKYYNRAKKFESCFITFESGARLELMYNPDLKAQNQSNVTGAFCHFCRQ